MTTTGVAAGAQADGVCSACAASSTAIDRSGGVRPGLDRHPHLGAARGPAHLLAAGAAGLGAVAAVGELGVVPHLLTVEVSPVIRTPRSDRRRGDSQSIVSATNDGREHHLRTGGAEAGIGLERVDERPQPVALGDRVVVEQRDVVDAVEVGEPEVAAAREPDVVGVLDHAHVGQLALDDAGDPVDRRVVDEHDLQRVLGPVDLLERREAAHGHLAAVVVEHDDAHPRRGRGHRCASAVGRPGSGRW